MTLCSFDVDDKRRPVEMEGGEVCVGKRFPAVESCMTRGKTSVWDTDDIRPLSIQSFPPAQVGNQRRMHFQRQGKLMCGS